MAAIVERFQQESMYGLSAKKVVVVGVWSLVEVCQLTVLNINQAREISALQKISINCTAVCYCLIYQWTIV